MNRTTRTLLAALLALSLGAVAGCQKKAPEGAHKVDEGSQAGTTTEQAPAIAVAEDGSFTVGPLTGKLPEGWESRPPSSAMRTGEFLIENPEENGLPGLVTVFYFGPSAGTVEMNIDRWVGQFTQADGAPLTPEMVNRETFESDGMDITMVSFAGKMGASSMGGVQMHEMAGWMNVSGIVLTPQGPWFFKGTGPEALMTAEKGKFKAMLESFTYSAD